MTTTKEPYTQEISRATPACFLFLIDQSLSMEERIAGDGPPKCEQLASAINYWINAMIIKATGDAGIKDWMEIAVIGYTTDDAGNPIIGSALGGELAEPSRDSFVPISQFQQHPLRVVQKTQQIVDTETSEIMEVPVDVTEWIDPVAAKGTPMCFALHTAYGMLDRWISTGSHNECFPPIVIHITDGETSDEGNPEEYAESVRSLATQHGNVLVFNCHLSAQAADKILFPGNVEMMPDNFAKTLYRMSSVLPAPMVRLATTEGFKLETNARGFIFNADTVSLLQFLDMGTRVSKNLR